MIDLYSSGTVTGTIQKLPFWTVAGVKHLGKLNAYESV